MSCPHCESQSPVWEHLMESLACRVDTYGVESLTEREQIAYETGQTAEPEIPEDRAHHPAETIEGLGACELCWRRQAQYVRTVAGVSGLWEVCRKCWYKEAALERMGVR